VDALIPAFIAVLLAETGGKVQALAGRDRQLLALALSTVISLGLAVAGGVVIATMIGAQPRTLLAGLALVFAGVPMLFPAKPLSEGGDAPGFAKAFFRFLAAQLGDASQFIAFAIAARSNMPLLALAGGFGGVMLAGALPGMFGKDWPEAAKLRLFRWAAALLLTGAGVWLAITALRLI
jgi:putative Ca2+/H+ antiporter (TMEM165/GDT1 family)